MFLATANHLGIRYPLGDPKRHLNLKRIFAVHHGCGGIGMVEALERVGFPLGGRHHRGLDDARNIVKIADSIVRNGGRSPEGI